MDQRQDPRFQTRFDALVSSGRQEGAGILVDISRSGARIEDASLQPPIGTKIRIYVFVQPMSPFELEGHVVRHTETGFAIECGPTDSDLGRMIDDIAALVSVG